MSSASKIEWTNATWNPVRGCSIVSKGCTNCYAMRQAHRFSGKGRPYEGLTKLTKGGPVWTGKARMVPELLDAPLHWKKPRRIFVNSMSDLFHDDVDAVFIGSVLGIASACPQHTFQVLTKRPQRMLDILRSEAFLEAYESSQEMYTHTETPWPAPNVWLGVSVEDQASADERIPLLLKTPVAVRWISAEPLLGAVKFRWDRWLPVSGFEQIEREQIRTLDWVVAGGESGPGARPMHPDWARSLRDQCGAVGVPFFFKQWGAWLPAELPVGESASWEHGGPPADWPWDQDDPRRKAIDLKVDVHRVGKHTAGRLLDGRTHDEYPA